MRVLFDAYWWSHGPRSNSAVQRQMISTWFQNYPQDELAIAVPGGTKDVPAGIDHFRTRLPLQAFVNAVELPSIARRWSADVVISHNFAAPASTAHSVVFIHDLLFIEHPEWFTTRENLYFRLMKLMGRRADLVATSSYSEARRISQQLNDRAVEAIGLAISPSLVNSVSARPARVGADKFLLTVARLNTRKNLERTVEGAVKSGTLSPEQPLVVVGEASGKFDKMSVDVATMSEQGSIILLESVTDGELRWLYENTNLFLHLSLGEGFGLPGIEALHFGAPVVASDLAVFHETLQDRASFVNPYDPGQIARKIRESTRDRSTIDPNPTGDERYTWSKIMDTLRNSIESALA